jgi:hypothetical protein
MSPPDVVIEHYQAQRRQAESLAILLRRLWRRVSIDDLDGSWAAVASRAALVVASAQLGAARAGAEYVPLALAAAGLEVNPEGAVQPRRFAGVASDGRGLEQLLYSGVIRVKQGLAGGAQPADAVASGRKWLEAIGRTQVADASRAAAGVAITARPRVGYTRMVNPPCCQRCAVLAGRFFRWNQGFLRHPGCDCRHTPTTEQAAPDLVSEVDPGQIRDLTGAQRNAIADGADMNQVINAHRKGARSSDGMTTTEGTTRRGLAGQRGSRQRLTPDAIYRTSATREEAIGRLRTNGYLL